MIWLQLVIMFNLGVFIMLRKYASLGHFVLWCLTPHAIIPNPKGKGQLAQISIVGLFPSFGGWAGKVLSSSEVPLGGEEDESDCTQKPEKERDRVELGKSHFLI